MDGMRFLPVDQRLYLRAQFVVNMVGCTFPSVRHCMLLHQDKLVWSGEPRPTDPRRSPRPPKLSAPWRHAT